MFFSPEGTVDKLKKKILCQTPIRSSTCIGLYGSSLSTYPVAYFG